MGAENYRKTEKHYKTRIEGYRRTERQPEVQKES